MILGKALLDYTPCTRIEIGHYVKSNPNKEDVSIRFSGTVASFFHGGDFVDIMFGNLHVNQITPILIKEGDPAVKFIVSGKLAKGLFISRKKLRKVITALMRNNKIICDDVPEPVVE